MTRFDTDTALVPTGAHGRFDCHIHETWWVAFGPNGGHVSAIAVRALEATFDTEERPLRSLTVHFARAPKAGPASVEVDTVRAGRSVTFATARMLQDGAVFATAQAVLAMDAESLELHTPYELPDPPAQDFAASAPNDQAPPFIRQFDFVPTLTPPAGEAVSGGWIRLREQRELDAALVTALTDSWLPALYVLTGTPIAIPTLDLTVHLRGLLPRPADWTFVRVQTREAGRGFAEEDAEVIAADGTLLAQSRQLALIR